MKDEKIDIIRHGLSHMLAMAIKYYYPSAKLAIGPVIEGGFYYDVDTGDKKISEDDLKKLEDKMKEFIKQDLKFEKRNLSVEEAIVKEKERQEDYKVELIEDLAKEGQKEVIYYKVGNFDDLCRGPHVESTKEIDPQSFTLNKVAGAYWRGDENRQMLTRIYGLAFSNKKELKQYLNLLEEAKKRDHRKIGKDLNLFIFSDTVGKGLPMLTAKGATIRRELENFIVKEEIKRGYDHVITPDLAKLDLYKKSGHYPYYKDSMYAPIRIDDEEFMLRPMACPHHFELYLNSPKSYKDLPMRIAELAKLYRYEQSGELSGLMRVRGFCLADSHIICADREQAQNEVSKVLDLIEYVCEVLKIEKNKDYWFRLSLGDRTDPKKYYKNDKAWDEAEESLREVLRQRKTKYEEVEAEAAFYGPKLDIQMKNVLGKEDTAFTVQWDFVMPERFNLVYTDKKGKEQRALVIHRSSIGALERIMAFLIEFYGGNFPLWLAPIQVKLISVGEGHKDYTQKLASKLKDEEIRVEADISEETVGNKIRKAVADKIPYILVIGDKEMEGDSLAVRKRGERQTSDMKEAEFISSLKKDIKERK
ncbi:MAG: threonine--tRNA ligase [Parcubacteria group bacterium]